MAGAADPENVLKNARAGAYTPEYKRPVPERNVTFRDRQVSNSGPLDTWEGSGTQRTVVGYLPVL